MRPCYRPCQASDADGEQTGERWIGINWGTSYNRIYGKDEAYVENQVASAARFLIDEGYKIYVYPVWGPDREACKRLCDKIAAPDKVVYDAEVHSYETYLQLMKRFNLTINFKLHANVLSAAADVPFICWGTVSNRSISPIPSVCLNWPSPRTRRSWPIAFATRRLMR
ncbi:polysaccharide pyruvyl transferase family protein [Paenibacillus thiaminolyticus]|uniref:polysaccharide pyruvyl transferase family protein n=1 Tax=Paenibacillus thiaminolyticus TaxID=49283 RepID=UPI003D2B34EC